nr:cytochrome c oxidase subunit II [Pseudomonadota bacterium]
MNTLLKIFAVAAAFGLAPAAAGQSVAPAGAAPAASAAPAAQPVQQPQARPVPPTDAISAQSQADPAQPEEVSDPRLAQPGGEEPSEAQIAAATVASRTSPLVGIGQPDGRMGVQDQVTPIGQQAAWFHNVLLMPLITIISLFVLALLLYVVVRYRRSANPVPSRTTHNTLIEVVWTLVPVLILVAIAVPSIKLLANQYSPPKADLTVKVVGNQWYWTYQYPDNGDFEIVSNVLTDAQAKARGEPRQLAVDERMVVPAGAVVKLIVTSADVIHAFGVPAFWVKMDAVPGRLNETWFKVDRPGLYYGQCYELCGARHAYMPIAVEVLPPAQFAAWVASKGGTMPGGAQAKSGDETATSPALGAPAPDIVPTAGGSATETSPEPNNTVD